MAEEKTGFFAEFKKFVVRGNVIDMAVGIIVGGLFNNIVNSFVKDILNPILGFIIGGKDFTELRIVLKAATEATEEVAIRYGNLIQAIVQFLLTALVLFTFIRGINRMKEAAEKAKELVKKETAD